MNCQKNLWKKLIIKVEEVRPGTSGSRIHAFRRDANGGTE